MLSDIILYGLALVGTVWVGLWFWVALIFLINYILECNSLLKRVTVLEAHTFEGERKTMEELFDPPTVYIPKKIMKKRRKKK